MKVNLHKKPTKEDVETFCSITKAKKEIARAYLRENENDIPQATLDYLSNPTKYQVLPDDIIFYIFCFLKNNEVLDTKFKLVCSSWFEVLDDDNYYEYFLKQRLYSNINPRIPIKKQFIQRYLLQRDSKLVINEIQPVQTKNEMKIGIIYCSVSHLNTISENSKKRFFSSGTIKYKIELIKIDDGMDFSKIPFKKYHSFILEIGKSSDVEDLKKIVNFMKLNLNSPVFSISSLEPCRKEKKDYCYISYDDLLNFAFDIKATSIHILPDIFSQKQQISKECIDQSIKGATLRHQLTQEKNEENCNLM
eukprot:gene4290-7646_t